MGISRDLGLSQADEPSTDQPLGHIEVSLGVNRQAVGAVEFPWFQQTGGNDVSRCVFIIGPSINVANLFVGPKVADKLVVLSAQGKPGPKFGDHQQISMGDEPAGRGEEAAAEHPLVISL